MPKLDREAEHSRLIVLSEFERPYWNSGVAVAGMDEVGRGPLAGPVVAAAVVMPPERLIEGVKDSKKLSKKKLAELDREIRRNALAVGLGWMSEKVIDEINILQATKKAFAEAYKNLGIGVCTAFIDAVKDLEIDAEQRPIIHGDALCYSIAAASIVAKVARDSYMIEMAAKYPQYGFEKNVGYGTKQHIDALKKFGPCEIHRRSFIGNFVGE